VIRHSTLMLLFYVALIGSAGWLIAITPQGFIPAQDRGYVIISAQLPARRRWRAPRTSSVRSRRRRWTPGYHFASRPSPASQARPETQAGNAAALFPVFEEPEVRLKKACLRR